MSVTACERIETCSHRQFSCLAVLGLPVNTVFTFVDVSCMTVVQVVNSKAETVHIVACHFSSVNRNCDEWAGEYGYVLCHLYSVLLISSQIDSPQDSWKSSKRTGSFVLTTLKSDGTNELTVNCFKILANWSCQNRVSVFSFGHVTKWWADITAP